MFLTHAHILSDPLGVLRDLGIHIHHSTLSTHSNAGRRSNATPFTVNSAATRGLYRRYPGSFEQSKSRQPRGRVS